MKVVILLLGIVMCLKQKKEKLAPVMNVYMEHEDIDDGDIERRRIERENDIRHIKEIKENNNNNIKQLMKILKEQNKNAYKINENLIINNNLHDF